MGHFASARTPEPVKGTGLIDVHVDVHNLSMGVDQSNSRPLLDPLSISALEKTPDLNLNCTLGEINIRQSRERREGTIPKKKSANRTISGDKKLKIAKTRGTCDTSNKTGGRGLNIRHRIVANDC